MKNCAGFTYNLTASHYEGSPDTENLFSFTGTYKYLRSPVIPKHPFRLKIK
jgi:hypothetical protein